MVEPRAAERPSRDSSIGYVVGECGHAPLVVHHADGALGLERLEHPEHEVRPTEAGREAIHHLQAQNRVGSSQALHKAFGFELGAAVGAERILKIALAVGPCCSVEHKVGAHVNEVRSHRRAGLSEQLHHRYVVAVAGGGVFFAAVGLGHARAVKYCARCKALEQRAHLMRVF